MTQLPETEYDRNYNAWLEENPGVDREHSGDAFVKAYDEGWRPVVLYNDSHVNLILCYIHNVFEVMRPDAYRVCFECKHVYNTPADLEKAYAREVVRMNETDPTCQPPLDPKGRKANEIYFCQECVHDF